MYAIATANVCGLPCGRRHIHLADDEAVDQLLFECSKYIEQFVQRNRREATESVLELVVSITATDPGKVIRE
jgi:hypothetical protein